MEDAMNKLFFILSVLLVAIEIGCSGDSVGPKDPDPPTNTVQVATVVVGYPSDVFLSDTLWMPSDSTFEFTIIPKDERGNEITPTRLRENNLIPTVSLVSSAATATIISRLLPGGEYYLIRIVATGLTSDSLTERGDALTLTVGNITVKKTFVFQPNISRLNYHWVRVGNNVDGKATQFIHNNGDYTASNSLFPLGTPNSFRIRKNRPIPLSPDAIQGNVTFPAISTVRPSRLNGNGRFGSGSEITYVAEIRNF